MSISAKSLLFSISGVDLTTIVPKLQSWMHKKNIENALITTDGECLISSDRPIFLKCGMATVARGMDMDEVPRRITTFKNLPLDYLIHKFHDGYNVNEIRVTIGMKFQESAIRQRICKAIQKRTCKVTNANMLCSSTVDVVTSGPPTPKRLRVYTETDVRELLAFAYRKDELLDIFLERFSMQIK